MASGLFPLDERWGLSRSVYSPGLAEQMVWLSGLLPYEQASQVFKRVAGRHIPAASLWRQTEYYGERLHAYQQNQQEQVKPDRVLMAPARTDHLIPKGISLDGGMVHIREEGWKEFKVGTVFDVVQRLERDPPTGELVERPQAQNLHCTAVLGSVNEFSPALWHLAVAQGVPTARTSSVTADGAEWIWNLAADLFPDSAEVVDWYHACQHLAQAAQALFSDDPDAAQRWFKTAKDFLFFGEIHRITAPLDAADLSEHSRYFHTHKHRMHYQRFLAEGFPIGSGTVESHIKQFKHRLAGPGMRWSRPRAQRMLLIRSAVLDHSFHDLWALACPLN